MSKTQAGEKRAGLARQLKVGLWERVRAARYGGARWEPGTTQREIVAAASFRT